MDQSVIARVVRVAPGRFAPGHLGELTQQVPFEMVDAVLAQTGAVQSRIRVLPARVVVYLLLAGCLFAELGYGQVWHRLVAGLDGLAVAHPSPAALTQARRRLGAAPLRALFDLLRGPAAVPGAAAGVRWRGLLVCAIDGTIMTVADSPANLAVFTEAARRRHRRVQLPHAAPAGPGLLRHPQRDRRGVRADHQRRDQLRRRAAGSLRPGMIVLADRNFGAGALAAQICQAQAEFLIRVRTGRGAPKLPVLRRCRDGSYLSRFGGVPVRVIDAQITIATSAGRATGGYRLITTLPDPRRYPAGDLVTLYHQRWDIETAYLELKSTILGGRVLRARTPAGVDQEVYALLVTYQILRTAMADATSTRPGTDPDRASFTIALHAARDQLIQAAGVIAGTTIDLAGTIGRRVLANLDARPAAAHQPPHRQTRHLQIQRPRPHHRPGHLQGHHRHQHPHRHKP